MPSSAASISGRRLLEWVLLPAVVLDLGGDDRTEPIEPGPALHAEDGTVDGLGEGIRQGGTAAVVTGREVTELPLSGRNFTQP